jgi:hypothetical protein
MNMKDINIAIYAINIHLKKMYIVTNVTHAPQKMVAIINTVNFVKNVLKNLIITVQNAQYAI